MPVSIYGLPPLAALGSFETKTTLGLSLVFYQQQSIRSEAKPKPIDDMLEYVPRSLLTWAMICGLVPVHRPNNRRTRMPIIISTRMTQSTCICYHRTLVCHKSKSISRPRRDLPTLEPPWAS